MMPFKGESCWQVVCVCMCVDVSVRYEMLVCVCCVVSICLHLNPTVPSPALAPPAYRYSNIMTMTNVDGGRGGHVQNSWETQAAEERRMDSLRAIPGAGKQQVNAKFWDVGKGAFVTSTEPNQMSKSKHQINSLAAQVCVVSGSEQK